ncbi:class I poly(R)-hydroxyalkanoic acid synthase [Planktotalea sp.]|uniref:class I poly(R)-hydroxyalkanoic acid synthase n=1 Tax=Planktotalea sp. TaxID=2029877 RepID=UPI0025D283BB|nr:class I poly(R)-hydroxyalkanoic acid synthase [Planktotalea sp.]
MTTNDDTVGQNSPQMKANLAKIEALSERLLKAVSGKAKANPALNGPDQALFTSAMSSYWQKMVENPASVFETQAAYWGKSVKHYVEAQQVLAKGKLEAPSDAFQGDRRFSNPMWNTHPYFNFVKQQYLINSEAIAEAVAQVEDLDAKEKRRLTYFSQQIIDMMAPTNFLGTNPDALEKAVATEGQSLLDGLENLVGDLEANEGELIVKLADEKAFKLGENIATTPGKVIYRNRMMELIQYTPVTETVHETPLIMFPPWINKFYILDLKKQNSMIKWITEQGYSLFVVSWINPDDSFANAGLEDYVDDGYLTAIREVKAITGQEQVNCIGYCIAGTTLSLTMSLLKKRGDKSIKSATLFTALTDFSDQGEFTPFLQNDFIDGIEEEVNANGLLRSFIMARTFSFLRSNDLVYTPAIKSYMMGEAPPAFDLLFWNGDGANLPGRMAVQYLRGLCQSNEFADGGFEMFGETLHLKDVDVPVCSIACETDHIAAWKTCYHGAKQMSSKSKTFIVTQSGHIAGIVNPPSRNRYGHYTNDDMTLDADAWMAGAEFSDGSWWPRWESWLKKRSGKQIAALQLGDDMHPELCDAPGTYVKLNARR